MQSRKERALSTPPARKLFANGFFVILVIVAGAIVMGYETVQSSYSVKEMAPRVVLGILAANASLLIAGLAIDLANALSQAFLGQGIGPASATGTMRVLVLTAIAGGGTFLVLVGLAVAVLVLLLAAVWVIRVSLVVVLVAGSPLALACHALPQTEGAAQFWWRALAACLGIQVAQSLVLITALRVFFDPEGRAALVVPRAAVLALGRRDGLPADRLALAAVGQLRRPRRLVPAPEGIAPLPRWLARRAGRPPALLELPVRGIDPRGVVDLGTEGAAVVCAASSLAFGLRTEAEQEALVGAFGRFLNALASPVQIVVRAERADLRHAIAVLEDQAGALPHPALEAAAREH